MTPVIRTFTGKQLNPLDIQIEDIDIEDIAHALSQINRFNGHVKKPISVAQHSVYCCRICDETDLHARQALLHDAAEAYLGDVTKWLKHTPEMLAFRRVEDKLQRKIFEKFHCPYNLFTEVEEADRIMVRFEGMKGFGPKFKIDHPNYPPLTEEQINRVGPWGHWSWRKSKELFLVHFRMYGGV